MGINLTNNTHYKQGGQIIFIPEDCEYLQGGKSLDIRGCKIYMRAEDRDLQINKTIYSVMLCGGKMSIHGDSVIISDAVVHCSGDLEEYAKSLAAYCRLICGKEKFEIAS